MIALRRHARLAVLPVLVALAVACGGRTALPENPTIEDLRRAAAESPRDPDAQRRLAIAELLMREGDAGRAQAQIERARALATDDERLAFVAGVERSVHGHPSDALDHYLDALEAASRSTRPVAPHVAEAAILAIEDSAEVASRWRERVTPRLAAIARTPGNIGAAARHRVTESLVEIAYREGNPDAVRTVAAQGGCITDWRIAGPFGPRDLLGFDDEPPVEPGQPLAGRYDLGPRRGERDTRDHQARGCSVHLGGELAEGGSTFAQGTFEVERGGPHLVRLETPNAVRLWIDGEPVARLDARERPTARTTFHRVELEPGAHRFTAQVTTRHPNPILVAAVLPGAQPPGRPEVGDPLGTYLAAAVGMSRGDPIAAREALRHETPEREAASAVLQLGASVALADPHRPGDQNRDEARRLLRAAARRDPAAWYPPVQLARLDAADGRILQSIEGLREAAERWPEVVDIPLTLAELLLGRGWYAQADREVERALEVAPGTCRPIRAALASAERRSRYADMHRLADDLVACDARSSTRYQLWARSRRWERASEELERLAALEPSQDREGILTSRIELARGRGDGEAVDQLLAELHQERPQSLLTPIARADRLLAEGQRQQAAQVLASAVEAEPSAVAELRLVERAVTGEFALSPYRLDGEEVLEAFEASGRSYDEPEVLVLDYTVVRVFPDGSTLELTHNIWRVQSEEALDERGEFQPPQDAQVLTLHTIDGETGRRIEPDAIEGKDTVSLPSLSPGDYVEYEYVRLGDPPGGLPGAWLGNRFYFRSFETPFDRSEYVVVVPRSWEPTLDPRGRAPETEERVEEDVRVLRWAVTESRPLTPEPMSVAPREYIPSIDLGVDATWESFVDGLRDALADRDVRDPEAARLVARVLGDATGASEQARARRLHAWVLENVEENGDAFGLAPAMLFDRTGNRARVLRYMLELAGVDGTLVLARSAASDHTRSSLPDTETFEHLLVVVGEGDEAVYLSTAERGAPFGYVPPLLRGEPALVLAPGAPRLRVPEGPEGQDRRTVEVDVHLGPNGSAHVAVVETYRGSGAVSWRNELEGVPDATLESRFEEAYVARLLPGATMTDLRITGRETPDRPVVFRYEFDVRSLGRRQGDRWIVPGLFPTQMAATYARLGERTTTQLVAPPLDLDVRVTLHVPEGMRVPSPPPDLAIDGPGPARFVLEAAREGRTVTFRRKVRLPVMRVTPEEYPGLARFARAVDQAEARELALPL